MDQKANGVSVPKMTPRDIESLVQIFESGDWNTLELKFGDSEIFLSKRAGERPSWANHPLEPRPPAIPEVTSAISARPKDLSEKAPKATRSVQTDTPPGHIIVSAPSLGTFYRAAKPGVPPFVDIGQAVTADTELCLIEVMKLFTTLRAGVGGTVTQICVADGDMIELGQPLFVIDPNG